MHVRQTSLEDDTESVFDLHQTKNYIAFVVGSLRRHKSLAALVLGTILLGASLAVWSMPSSYHAEAKVLAQKNQALQVRGDGAPGAEGPTRAAAEAVLRRSNLVALIGQTDLLDQFDAHRAPIERARDAVMHVVSRAPTEEERLDAMIERLEKKLHVWTVDGTVSIAVDWSNPQMAKQLIDISQQNYLETRYAQEITAFGESLAILEGHAAGLRGDIDEAVARITALRDAREPQKASSDGKPGDGKPAVYPARGPEAGARAAERRPEGEEGAQVRATIAAKQRALDDLSDFRRRRLSELQARLAELRGTYTENHPSVIDTQQAIGAMAGDSPQIKSLRAELAALKGEQAASASAAAQSGGGGVAPSRGGGGGALAGAIPRVIAPQLPGDLTRLDLELREDREPAMVYARGQLRDAMDKYAAFREKVQAAQIDLETAQAAFKYRYSVITPAQLPKRPRSPNVPLILLGALLGGVLSALLAAIVADLRRGVFVERWQVERILDRPVLAEIEIPALPRASSE